MDTVTGSIYWEYPGVDRHHLNIRNTHSISQFGETRGICDRVNLRMYLEAVFVQGWRYISRVRWSKSGDKLHCHDGGNVAMYSEIVIERFWRCTCRP